MDRYAHVIQHVLSTPWAIRPEYAAIIQDILTMRSNGHRFTAEEITARIGAAQTRTQAKSSATIAVIPVIGVISHRMELMENVSGGGTSPDMIGRAFDSALYEPSVTDIVMEFDTPGGTVFGLPEVGEKIRNARGKKRVIGIANGVAASAGYWLLSQCEEVVVTPSGQVGSIGVLSMHQDITGMLEKEGVKINLIHFGKYKVEGNPFEALGEEARASIQADVDAYGGMFHRAVSKGRGVPVEKVRSEFGQGRMIMASDALARGMVDAVETFDDVIARLSKPKKAAYAVAGKAATAIESPVRIAHGAHVVPQAGTLAEATEPQYAVGSRVRSLVDHMPGMKDRVGEVREANAGAPPYYAVLFDGESEVHKWLAENEIEPVDAEAEDDSADEGMPDMAGRAVSADYYRSRVAIAQRKGAEHGVPA
jgi:capsid assembly protease